MGELEKGQVIQHLFKTLFSLICEQALFFIKLENVGSYTLFLSPV